SRRWCRSRPPSSPPRGSAPPTPRAAACPRSTETHPAASAELPSPLRVDCRLACRRRLGRSLDHLGACLTTREPQIEVIARAEKAPVRQDRAVVKSREREATAEHGERRERVEARRSSGEARAGFHTTRAHRGNQAKREPLEPRAQRARVG